MYLVVIHITQPSLTLVGHSHSQGSPDKILFEYNTYFVTKIVIRPVESLGGFTEL